MVKKILKFGGTSVGTIERIQHVANIIKKEHDSGNQIIAVVSAMSGKTKTATFRNTIPGGKQRWAGIGKVFTQACKMRENSLRLISSDKLQEWLLIFDERLKRSFL